MSVDVVVNIPKEDLLNVNLELSGPLQFWDRWVVAHFAFASELNTY